MTAGLILKLTPIGWNQHDYDVVEDAAPSPVRACPA
jgi:hypothetical protein